MTNLSKGAREGFELSISPTIKVKIRKHLYVQVLAHWLVLIKIDFQEQDLRMFLSSPAQLINNHKHISINSKL